MTKKPTKPAAKSRRSPRSSSKPSSASGTKAHTGAKRAPRAGKRTARVPKPVTPKVPRVRRGDEVVELLQRKKGATIAEMVTRFGIQPHTLRAIISVESRKRGLKVELVGKAHYRIV